MTSSNPRFWCAAFFLNVFCLLLDTVMAWVEIVVTVTCDTPYFAGIKRKYILLFYCILIVLGASMYTSNVGFIHRSMADGGILGYLLNVSCLTHCIAASWVHKFQEACENFGRRATIILIVCYWVPIVISGVLHLLEPNWMLYTAPVIAVWMILVIIFLKFYTDYTNGKSELKNYLEEFVCYGSLNLFVKVLDLSHEITEETFLIRAAKVWWGFSLKFFIPWALTQVIVNWNLFDGGYGLLSDVKEDKAEK